MVLMAEMEKTDRYRIVSGSIHCQVTSPAQGALRYETSFQDSFPPCLFRFLYLTFSPPKMIVRFARKREVSP